MQFHFHLNRANKLLAFILAVALSTTLVLGMAACSGEEKSDSTAADGITQTNGRKLLISAEAVSSADDNGVTIPRDALGGNFPNSIVCSNLKNVTVSVDGQDLALADAIRDGAVTVEALRCYAQLDAKNGICTEESKSINGVAFYIYHYPEYDLRSIHDIYELPSGEQLPLDFFDLFSPGTATYQGLSLRLLIEKEPQDPFDLIDKEDWGLQFTLGTASSTGMTLSCTQTGGQQLGNLRIYHYMIYSLTDAERTYTLSSASNPLDIPLEPEGETEVTLDWADIFGPLPADSYAIRIKVEDVYDPETVNALVRKYHDWQWYDVAFTVE